AARNFLVSSENFADNAPLVKLADFGLAVNLAPGENVHVGVESEAIAVRWTAPESIAQGHFSFAS
uniref:LPTK22=CYTOPLASMIC tyrosine protein kinase n=1 Tax=Hirudo medicinalis TaxID=6421 RepID=Q9TX17_HIRME|nr:LPTK22=cytoplasmic tyrosine protein kinase [Hirudo medicinalis=leeches, Annelida, embryonic, Peptide, 64 aa] [Hirudo medicinalis]